MNQKLNTVKSHGTYQKQQPTKRVPSMVHKEIDLDPIDYDNFHEKKQNDKFDNDDQFLSNSHSDSFQKELETPPPEIDKANQTE